MDDPALQERLAAIERRQYVIIVLLVVPYLFGLAKLIGFWTAGVLSVALAFVALVALIVARRRNRHVAGE